MRVLVFDAMLLGTATATQLPEMEDGVASQVDTLVRSLASARDAAVSERDAVITECATRLEAQAQDHATALKTLEDGIPARVEAEAMDRAGVLAGAAALGLTIKAEGKDTATLRREVITEASKDPKRKSVMDAMVPDLVKASPEALRLATVALFKMGEAAPKKDPARAHDALSKAIVGDEGKAKAADCAPAGRDAAMRASSQAWRQNRDKQQQKGA